MFRNLVTALFKHGRIETTEAKAKELRSWADQMITLAKRGDLHARRQAAAVIQEKPVLAKLFDEIAGKCKDRPGGYTRVVKLGPRRGDCAPMALIELVEEGKAKPPKSKPKAQKDKADKPSAQKKAGEKPARKKAAAKDEKKKEAKPQKT